MSTSGLRGKNVSLPVSYALRRYISVVGINGFLLKVACVVSEEVNLISSRHLLTLTETLSTRIKMSTFKGACSHERKPQLETM